MYRFLLVSFILIILMTTSCNLELGVTIPTLTLVPFPTLTEAPSTPASTMVPSATITPIAIPTVAPTSTVEIQNITEEFDGTIDAWSYFLVRGDESDMQIYTGDGKLTFEVNKDETYVYAAYKKYNYSDVHIEVLADNRGESNTNNIGMFCRYSEEGGWYEFNINSTGFYYIYYVDSSTGKYIFNTIGKGASLSINTGKASNQYAAICQGDQLSLIINGKEMKPVYDTTLEKGLVGISVSTVNVYPVVVDFEWVSISEP